MAADFLASIYPTISSAKHSRITLSSTPIGYNHFAKFWNEAVEGRSQFKYLKVAWNEIPGRDEAFKKLTISNIGEMMWNQEYDCQILGSSDTLIGGKKLAELTHKTPIRTYYEDKLKIYQEPILFKKDEALGKVIPGHYYAIVGDPSEGKKQDFYTISVIDLSTSPYEQVATYRDSECPYQHYATIYDELIKMYGGENTLTIIENNIGFGKDVLDILANDIGTDSMLYMEQNKKELGLRTTTRTKRVGCGNLRTLMEYEKLIVNDFDTISEFYKFVRKNNSYEAETGYHDDMVMGLVFFSCVQSTGFLDEFIEAPISFREKFLKEHQVQIDSQVSAIVMSNGMENSPATLMDDDDGDSEKMLSVIRIG